MKTVKWALPLAAALLQWGVAWGGDIDLQAIQAKLAAQDARMANQDAVINDLKAKLDSRASLGDSPEAITSIQKNAKVTVGGLLTTKYTFTSAKARDDAGATPLATGGADIYNARVADLAVTDAKVYFTIDVNEHFDAFFKANLQYGDLGPENIAEAAWVRWKNICQTGFGIKVGRDALVFGEGGVGELGSYAAGGDGLLSLGYPENYDGFGIPHNAWDISGVTQVTPYWEGLDGKLLWEVSFMQNIFGDTPYAGGESATRYLDGNNNLRSRNYGWGSVSTRLAYSPIEDLKFTFSLANYYSRSTPVDAAPYDSDVNNHSNTVYGLAVNYRPAILSRKLALWGQWIHGQNVEFLRGVKSDAVNFGASFDLRENLTWFVQGDYLRSRGRNLDRDYGYDKATAWAFYTGLQYNLPYGVSLEAGWKHEWVKLSNEGNYAGKIRANTLYGLIGFEF